MCLFAFPDQQEYVKQYDADSSGSIEFSEFCSMMLQHISADATPEQIEEEAFKVRLWLLHCRCCFFLWWSRCSSVVSSNQSLDNDKDNFINAADLTAFLGTIGETVPAAMVKRMISEADMTGAGKLDKAALHNVFRQVAAAEAAAAAEAGGP